MGRIAGLVKNGVLAVGGYRRQLARAPFPGLATLCFHNVIDDQEAGRVPFRALHVTMSRLRSYCRFLSRQCVPIGMAQALDAFERGEPLPRAVLLTFDDGYRNMLTRAAPILAEFGVPATFFVCPGQTDGGLLWFDAAAVALGDDAVEPLKSLPAEELLARGRDWPRSADVCPAAATMTPDELRRLADIPGMTIGAHTVNHPILSRGSTAFQRDELAGSRGLLAELLGFVPEALAYPNGRPDQDFTAETETLAAEAGFRAAFSTAASFTRPNHSRYRLPRFMMTDFSTAELAHRLALSWSRT